MRLLYVPAALCNQGGAWLLEIFTGHTTIALGAPDDTLPSRTRLLTAAKHLHHAPNANIPDGSRALTTLAVGRTRAVTDLPAHPKRPRIQ